MIHGLGRFPGEGNGNPLQYSCLQNPHGQRSLGLQRVRHNLETKPSDISWFSFSQLMIIFSKFIFNGNIIALQYCVSFCCPRKRISCIYPPFPSLPPLHPPSPTSAGRQSTVLSSLSLQQLPTSSLLYTRRCVYVSAAAASLQSCPTLCDPMDCSPPGSAVPGIFQARVLEWGAIAFSTDSVYLRLLFSHVHTSLLLFLWLYSCPADRFICTIFLASIPVY